MKVEDLMVTSVPCCEPGSCLTDAALIMWEKDCGCVPVVEDGGRVVGMITDRDICMAAATKGRPTSDIRVHEVVARQLFACRPEDEALHALEKMAAHQVRRLPVVNDDGRLEGILSLNDLVLAAKASKGKRPGSVAYQDIVKAFKQICEHTHHSQPGEWAAQPMTTA